MLCYHRDICFFNEAIKFIPSYQLIAFLYRNKLLFINEQALFLVGEELPLMQFLKDIRDVKEGKYMYHIDIPTPDDAFRPYDTNTKCVTGLIPKALCNLNEFYFSAGLL